MAWRTGQAFRKYPAPTSPAVPFQPEGAQRSSSETWHVPHSPMQPQEAPEGFTKWQSLKRNAPQPKDQPSRHHLPGKGAGWIVLSPPLCLSASCPTQRTLWMDGNPRSKGGAHCAPLPLRPSVPQESCCQRGQQGTAAHWETHTQLHRLCHLQEAGHPQANVCRYHLDRQVKGKRGLGDPHTFSPRNQST